jgi:hypothetical protein
VTVAIEECVLKVNDRKRLIDEDEEKNWEKLKELQSQIKVLMQPKGERFTILKYGRRFVKTGQFLEISGKKLEKVHLPCLCLPIEMSYLNF